jgi:hypothetical protein
MEESEDIQDPQDYSDNHYAIQDRLDRSLHGDEAVHQPQEETYYDKNFHHLE